MRSLFEPAARRDLLARLHALRPDSPRRWGRMSAGQMIAHLSDQMRHALGDAPVQARRGPLRWAPVRWASIYLLPWPHGRIKGPPEAFATPPGVWDADVAGLAALVERFVAHGPDREWPDHALFGRMRGRDWGCFVHKHFDYHFRQFGG